jgi:hypothetical protein
MAKQGLGLIAEKGLNVGVGSAHRGLERSKRAAQDNDALNSTQIGATAVHSACMNQPATTVSAWQDA